jgi:hypothetical protein
MLPFKLPSKIRAPAITKNRYEILFFYENPLLLINKKLNINLNNETKKLNNETEKLNNQEKISSNREKQIKSSIEELSTSIDFTNNIKEIVNKSNNQKKIVTVKNIDNINKKNNISYLNNYNIYSRLAWSKFYFYYRDEDSLNKRLSGQKPFDYKCEGQNPIFKTILKYLPGSTLLNRLITDKNIKSFNEDVYYLKNIFNNNISNNEIKKLKNKNQNLNSNQIKKKFIDNIRKKNKKYEKISDEDITKLMLEKINKMGIINKDDILENIKLHLNKDFLDLTKEEKEDIKNILKLEKPKSKEEYFKQNIKAAFDKIRKINKNIKYCLVIDIKKSGPFTLKKVGKEYNIQEGGTLLTLVIKIIVMIIFHVLVYVYIFISLIISSFVRIGPFNTNDDNFWRRLNIISYYISGVNRRYNNNKYYL